MPQYFITATGTDIGKTFVTCLLTRKIRVAGRSVAALKPVISGFNMENAENSDTGLLLLAQGMRVNAEGIERISPWRFSAPLSPDMAAKEEGRDIDIDAVVSFCRQHENTDHLFVEGAGGIMSPLNRHDTMLDLAACLGYPAILVTGSYLGAISHTLTACAVMRHRGVNLHCVIISESASSPVTPERTAETIRRFLPDTIPIHIIRRLDYSDALWDHASYLPDIIVISSN